MSVFVCLCVQCGGKNIRFVIMNNVLPSSVHLHEKYDLKGSTYKRAASRQELRKAKPTLKDLDFLQNHRNGLTIPAEAYQALVRTIERDCRVSIVSRAAYLCCIFCLVWALEHCRISPPRFLAECRKKRLNQASFVLLCFVLFAFSELCLVSVLSVCLICLLSCIFQREPM